MQNAPTDPPNTELPPRLPPRHGGKFEIDAVEAALARALEGATEVGRWDVVATLAGELRDRRLARETNVVSLPKRGSK